LNCQRCVIYTYETISICAVVCGADGWIDIKMYGIARKEWLEKFLELPNGIPSHDTFATGRETRPVEYFHKLILMNLINHS
jgi:hypothetical protein